MADQEFKALQEQANIAWLNIVEKTGQMELNSETVRQIQQAAALLLRIAKVHPSEEARTVESWLETLGRSVGLVVPGLERLDAIEEALK